MPNRLHTATPLIHAPAPALAEAFATAESFMAWLPPKGMTGRALEYEYREGGRHGIELTCRAGAAGKTSAQTDVTAGRFLALEPGRRMIMSVAFDSADPAFAGEMIMTWTFDPAPDGTQVTITAEHVPSGTSAEDHARHSPPRSRTSPASSSGGEGEPTEFARASRLLTVT